MMRPPLFWILRLLMTQRAVGSNSLPSEVDIISWYGYGTVPPSDQRNHPYRAAADWPWDSLEKKLRRWWGNVWYGESQRMLTSDKRFQGYELATGFEKRAQKVLKQVVDRHDSKRPCASLPVNVSLHAWRYDRRELEKCLHLGAHDGAACTMHCQNVPSVSVTLTCRKTSSGWQLVGKPPPGECQWMLDPEVVNTTGGMVQGMVRPMNWKWADGHTTIEYGRTFFGIPYADPPERFAYSKPLSSRWAGVRFTDFFDINKNSSLRMHCAGAAPLDEGTGIENCLFLDVYTPPGVNAVVKSRRPVLVMLPPTGFVQGDAWMDGSYDAAQIAIKDGTLVVVVAARQAGLGHWAHPALSREHGDSSVGNFGERDQRMALHWVQNNIEAFGGDPERVTLQGHSSGSFDVLFHVLSPGSRGLFSNAILESATFDSGWYWQDRDQAFNFYAEVGESMGCKRDSADIDQISCLRALPATAFFDNSQNQTTVMSNRLKEAGWRSDTWSILKTIWSSVTGRDGGYEKIGLQRGDSHIVASPLWPLLPFGPVVDGTDDGLPGTPRELYESGRINDVQVYISHTHDEGTIFAMLMAAVFPWQGLPSLTHASVDAILDWAFGSNASFTGNLLKIYPRSRAAPFYRLSHMITDSVFACSAKRFAGSMSVRHAGSVYWAEHTYPTSAVRSNSTIAAVLHRDFSYFFGTHHCLPTTLLFGYGFGDSFDWNDADEKDHNQIHCHYALFIHCGDPGATPDSECVRGLAAKKISLHACEKLSETDVYPFPAYDTTTQHRQQLHPFLHGAIVPPAKEKEACRFWDAAPAMAFQPSSCRGCAGKLGDEAKWSNSAVTEQSLLI